MPQAQHIFMLPSVTGFQGHNEDFSLNTPLRFYKCFCIRVCPCCTVKSQ